MSLRVVGLLRSGVVGLLRVSCLRVVRLLRVLCLLG